MRRIVLAVGALVLLGTARPARSEDCCTEMAAYANEVGELRCSDGINQWTCPDARGHYPAQRFCDSQGIGRMKCDRERPPVRVPWFWVTCGTVANRCPDGAASGSTVPADNDLCSGVCASRLGLSAACEDTKRNRFKEQAETLKRSLAAARARGPEQ